MADVEFTPTEVKMLEGLLPTWQSSRAKSDMAVDLYVQIKTQRAAAGNPLTSSQEAKLVMVSPVPSPPTPPAWIHRPPMSRPADPALVWQPHDEQHEGQGGAGA